ncbi:hypothetical protein BJ875DRAFT_154471 [Amylocarpus encephaloides]|uniref:Uncharacterized protein n=1 Tax=Amylocarpus encephaloides TaxID=45428 RepID=A0A9P7YB36_9HELO|nr:hypothetical protein BJ875DRAFT_154471 [Amylocarpus encephaloides]
MPGIACSRSPKSTTPVNPVARSVASLIALSRIGRRYPAWGLGSLLSVSHSLSPRPRKYLLVCGSAKPRCDLLSRSLGPNDSLPTPCVVLTSYELYRQDRTVQHPGCTKGPFLSCPSHWSSSVTLASRACSTLVSRDSVVALPPPRPPAAPRRGHEGSDNEARREIGAGTSGGLDRRPSVWSKRPRARCQSQMGRYRAVGDDSARLLILTLSIRRTTMGTSTRSVSLTQLLAHWRAY